MKVETIKIKMPIITEEELQSIDENFDEIVSKAEEIMVTKKDQVVWQRLLSKQKKTIKDLREHNDKLKSEYYMVQSRCWQAEKKKQDLQERIDKQEFLLKEKGKELKELYARIDKAIEYLTSYEAIETIQQFDHSKNNEDLDNSTINEMTRRYLEVHDKALNILQGDDNND